MTTLRTNAQNLQELDIALAELDSQIGRDAEGLTYPTYRDRGCCEVVFENFERSISRLAMFDAVVEHPLGELGMEIPTLWAKIRGHRYDKRIDHSTHSMWPFTGKLEPRLARACINLAVNGKADAVVVDPFCGSGTVILEANLMGFKTIGGDVDPFAVWLTNAKVTNYIKMFEDAFERLWHGHDTIPPIAQQRQSCPPTIATSTVSEQDADSTLAGSHGVDAIVTSPPYFDAIDYNARHREMRQLLGLSRPQVDTLGISQSLAEYSASVKQLSARMFESLVSGGRVVIVSASYHGVDTPRMYETALREAGMGPIVRLARDYRVPTLDITSDEILVMEKP